MVERNMNSAAIELREALVTLPGSQTTSRAKGSCRNLGYPASGRQLKTPAVRIGKARSRSR
jgi:hypothetical protein